VFPISLALGTWWPGILKGLLEEIWIEGLVIFRGILRGLIPGKGLLFFPQVSLGYFQIGEPWEIKFLGMVKLGLEGFKVSKTPIILGN